MTSTTGDRFIERVKQGYIPLLNHDPLVRTREFPLFAWRLELFWLETLTPDDEESGAETDWLALVDLAGLCHAPPPSTTMPQTSAGRLFAESLLEWGEGSWLITVASSVYSEEFVEENEESLESVALQLAGCLAADLEAAGMQASEFESISNLSN